MYFQQSVLAQLIYTENFPSQILLLRYSFLHDFLPCSFAKKFSWTTHLSENSKSVLPHPQIGYLVSFAWCLKFFVNSPSFHQDHSPKVAFLILSSLKQTAILLHAHVAGTTLCKTTYNVCARKLRNARQGNRLQICILPSTLASGFFWSLKLQSLSAKRNQNNISKNLEQY